MFTCVAAKPIPFRTREKHSINNVLEIFSKIFTGCAIFLNLGSGNAKPLTFHN